MADMILYVVSHMFWNYMQNSRRNETPVTDLKTIYLFIINDHPFLYKSVCHSIDGCKWEKNCEDKSSDRKL